MAPNSEGTTLVESAPELQREVAAAVPAAPVVPPPAPEPVVVDSQELPEPGDEELVRLEALLAQCAAQLIAAKSETSRMNALLRDAVERFEAVAQRVDPAQRGEVERQRDAAVERAIEAEAARAELLLKLDELLGHLAEAGQGEGGLPGESSVTTTARLAGTVRGLLSSRAELQEERDALAARLMLREHDVEHLQDLARLRERELAEAREHAELEQVTARSLEARLEELTSKNTELHQGLAREIEKNREVADELSRAVAERLVLRDELARAQADAGSARAVHERASGQAVASLRGLRELLGTLSASVERVVSGPSVTAAGLEPEAEPTEPGTPTFVQAIDKLEEQVSLRDQRIVELSAQLGRERGRLSSLHAALVTLRADANADPALAQRIDALLVHFGQSGSFRPPG